MLFEGFLCFQLIPYLEVSSARWCIRFQLQSPFYVQWMSSGQYPNNRVCILDFVAQVEVPDRKSICPDRPRRKVSMSRPSQTESAYVQTFVRSKFFVSSSCVQKSSCPDFRAFKIAYGQTFVRSKRKFVRSKIDNLCVHVQTFVRSKFFVSSSCVQKSSCPDFRAFKIAYGQTFVRSKRKFVRSKIDNLCVHVQTFVRSKLPMARLSCVPKENSCAPKLIICAFMSRLSCVQKALCPDFRAFKETYVQTYVQTLCVHFGLDISTFGLAPQPEGHSHYPCIKIRAVTVYGNEWIYLVL